MADPFEADLPTPGQVPWNLNPAIQETRERISQLEDVVGPELETAIEEGVVQYLGTGAAIGSAVNLALGGMRTAGVPLTLGADTSTVDTATAVHGRHPFHTAAPVNRFRIHIRNYAGVTDTAFSGALSFTGIWAGKHLIDGTGLTGKFESAPTQIVGAFSTPPDGGEYVTPWIARDAFAIDAYDETLFSYAYTCVAQNNIRQQGGGWRSTATGEASSANPVTAMTKSQTMPLDWWVEVEVAASTPLCAYGPGDSLLAGTGSSLPVYDSFAMRHAMANGIVPTILAIHGSNAGQWADITKQKWQKYASLSKPDAVLIEIMSNDIFGNSAVSFATAQARFATMVANVKAFFETPNIYATTILPRNGSAADREAVRVQYNDWLRALPLGIMNVFDLAASIQGGTADSIDSRYNSGDGIHLNTAGYAANARAITAPMTRVSLSSTLMNVPPANAPTASFTFSANGLTLAFNGTPSSDIDGSVVSYAWNFGDGSTTTGVTPSHTYAEAGTYEVTLVVTDNSGIASPPATQVIPVVPVLAPLPVAGVFRRYVASQIPKRAGQEVTTWNDSAGSGVPLTLTGAGLSSATAPTVVDRTGRHAVYFDGVTDGLAATLALAQPFSMFMAYRVVSIKPGANNVMLGGGVNVFISGSLNKWQLNAGAGLNVSALTPDTAKHVLGAVANGGASSLVIDTTRQTGAAGSGSKTALVVGQLPGSPVEIDVYEIDVYNGALTDAEVDSVISALKSEHGI